jgi:hypothetical protein
MVERGDLVCVHEPFSDLLGVGETDVDGRPFTSVEAFLAWLLDDTGDVHVFVKDTPNRRHDRVFADRRFRSEVRHAFLIRRPEEIAASHRAVEPNMTIDSIGLEHLRELHAAVQDPIVLDSDDLVSRPETTMRAYCEAVGLPFVPEALTWAPGDRREWRRSARWHVDVSASRAFERRARQHERTVENDAELARFAAHHRPSYEALHARRLRI